MAAYYEVSKAFRCTLPRMAEHQARLVQEWANSNCSLNSIFMNGRGQVVLVGLKDQARTSASFSRMVRAVLRQRGIDDRALRGKWLNLISAQEALTLCGARNLDLSRTRSAQQAQTADDDDVKVITLR